MMRASISCFLSFPTCSYFISHSRSRRSARSISFSLFVLLQRLQSFLKAWRRRFSATPFFVSISWGRADSDPFGGFSLHDFLVGACFSIMMCIDNFRPRSSLIWRVISYEMGMRTHGARRGYV